MLSRPSGPGTQGESAHLDANCGGFACRIHAVDPRMQCLSLGDGDAKVVGWSQRPGGLSFPPAPTPWVALCSYVVFPGLISPWLCENQVS